jgi:capsular polysaccharide biosynthesis protein
MTAALRKFLLHHIPPWLHPHLRSAQIAMTGAVGRLLRVLPCGSTSFGPPRKIAGTLAEYVDQRNRSHPGSAYYVEVHKGHPISRKLPRTVERPIHFEFFNEMSRFSPSAGVGVLPDGRVLTKNGVVIGPGDHLIADVSHTFFIDDPACHPIFLSAKLPRITRLDGTAAVLTTYRSDIYYHWMLDTLPRLYLLRESGIAYDKLIIPTQSRFQRDTLVLLGIDEKQVIADRGLHLQAARLIVPTLPGMVGNPPGWVCDFLRRSFLPALGGDESQNRRIYIARGVGGTRRILNEPELLSVLKQHAIETVYPETLPFLDQVKLFNSASLVIAAHGSGLTNLVFCRPGSVVVELFSPNYVTTPYWALANQIGLDYYYVMGQGTWDRSRGRGRTTHDNIVVDVEKIRAVLDDLGRRAASDRRRDERSASLGQTTI